MKDKTLQNTLSLNGCWAMDWLSEQTYMGEEEPTIRRDSDSVVSCPVPGYWEDLTDLFRTTALHTKLRWNPPTIPPLRNGGRLSDSVGTMRR